MASTSPRHRKTTGRVMHEFKHGELDSGPSGKGGKVKSRRQAIAIALKESGASKYESTSKNKRNFATTKRKEASGKTAQQETEGKSHVGAAGRRESSPSMGGRNATTPTRRGTRHAKGTHHATGGRHSSEATKAELYRRAQAKSIPGRSRMTKQQLKSALG